MAFTLSKMRIPWASAVGSTTAVRPAVKAVPGTETWPQEAHTATWVAYWYSISVRPSIPRTSSACSSLNCSKDR